MLLRGNAIERPVWQGFVRHSDGTAGCDGLFRCPKAGLLSIWVHVPVFEIRRILAESHSVSLCPCARHLNLLASLCDTVSFALAKTLEIETVESLGLLWSFDVQSSVIFDDGHGILHYFIVRYLIYCFALFRFWIFTDGISQITSENRPQRSPEICHYLQKDR
jgi:hypothetical protein